MTRPAADAPAGRVSLRNVADPDLPFLYEHQKDPEAVRLAAFPSRDREAFMAHWARIRIDPTVIVRTIVCGADVAGNIGSYERNGLRMIGYWIGRAYWGRGIATAALSEFLFHDRARPLHAYVATQNIASVRVLEKCGFRACGRVESPGMVGDNVEEKHYCIG